jgi:hypothetical protein
MTSNYTIIKITVMLRCRRYAMAEAIDNKGNTYVIVNVTKDTRYAKDQYWQVATKDIKRCKADKAQDFWMWSCDITEKLIIKNGKLVIDANFKKTYTDLNCAKSSFLDMPATTEEEWARIYAK